MGAPGQATSRWGRDLLVGDHGLGNGATPGCFHCVSDGLTRGMRGRLGVTWPVGFWPLRIPIDHALHSAGVIVRDVRVGPDVGSDHFPLVVEARLARPGAALP